MAEHARERDGLAGRSARAWARLVVVAALTLTADLRTKWAAFRHINEAPVRLQRSEVLAAGPGGLGALLTGERTIVVVPWVLELKLVLNPGAVFGIGPGQRGFFVAFTALALGVGLYMFARATRVRDAWVHAALGLLIGGGLGNLYDRLRFGCVRDFLHPLPGVTYPWGWDPFGTRGEVWPYVSNGADLFLLVGIVILIAAMWRRDGKGAGAGKPRA